MTALMLAIKMGHFTVFKALVAAGANKDAKDNVSRGGSCLWILLVFTIDVTLCVCWKTGRRNVPHYKQRS